jgi:hypothetical protein
MKTFVKTIVIFFALGLLGFGCSSDKVTPVGGSQNGGPNIAGVLDWHPDLDWICSTVDTALLVSEDGPTWCNKCYDMFGSPRPCDGQDSATVWGNVMMMNGIDSVDTNNDSIVDTGENLFVANIQLSSGWFVENVKVATSNTNNWVQNNGILQIQQDWWTVDVNPVVNFYQFRKLTTDLPAQFDLALRLSVISLDLFSQEITGSRTVLWSKNMHASNSTHPSYCATSPFLTHFAPSACNTGNGGCLPAQTYTECKMVYTGIVCPSNTLNSVVLDADPKGATNPTYAWSTGAQTASITVSPAVATSYTVTVTSGNCPTSITTYNVGVLDAACTVLVPGSATTDQAVSFGGFASGQRITNQLSAQGVTSVSASGGTNQAKIFDSAVPTGGDTDLGTPNQAFGGPGVGSAGATSNSQALGKLLVIQENSGAPNDNANGGTLVFNFASARTMTSIKLVDVEGAGSFVRLVRSSGSAINIPIPVTGDNGTVTLSLNNTANVTQLRVRLMGSGAVANIATKVPVMIQTPAVKVCDVPPGKPSAAASYCVEYDDLNYYIDGVCGSSQSGKPGSYLGDCGTNPCAAAIAPKGTVQGTGLGQRSNLGNGSN